VIPLSGYPEKKDSFAQKKQSNEILDKKWYRYQNAKDFVIDLPDLRRDIHHFKYNMSFDGSPLIGKAHLMAKSMWSVPSWVFAESTAVEFEGESFRAPIGYDYYLKHRFGDYMQLPPEGERHGHGFIPFWKQEEQ
jgi:phosphorylcholine metabolism protein LicD